MAYPLADHAPAEPEPVKNQDTFDRRTGTALTGSGSGSGRHRVIGARSTVKQRGNAGTHGGGGVGGGGVCARAFPRRRRCAPDLDLVRFANTTSFIISARIRAQFPFDLAWIFE